MNFRIVSKNTFCCSHKTNLQICGMHRAAIAALFDSVADSTNCVHQLNFIKLSRKLNFINFFLSLVRNVKYPASLLSDFNIGYK